MVQAIDELSRFRMLMAGVYIGIGISSSYGFSIFSEHMKAKYKFTQGDITTISTVGNCCGYMVFFSGMLFDYAGPKVLLPFAGLLTLIGYMLYGLTFDDVIKSESRNGMMIKFCVFTAIMYFGCPSMDVGALMPLMLNFPVDRGYMVMIQKTFSGLGTSVLMAYYNGWFRSGNAGDNSNYSGYAYFIGVQAFVVACIGAYFIDLPPYYSCQFTKNRLTEDELAERQGTLKVYMRQRAPRKRLYIGCFLVAVCLVFLTTTSIVTGYVETAKKTYVAISVIVVILVSSFAVLGLPFRCLGEYPEIIAPTKFATIGIAEGNDDDDEEEEEENEGKRNNARINISNSSEEMSARKNNEPASETDVMRDESKTSGQVLAIAAEHEEEEEEEDHSNINNNNNNNSTHHSISRASQSTGNRIDKAQVTEQQEHMKKEEDEEESVPQSSAGDPQYQGNFWKHLLTPDLWFLWISCFGMWGTGTVMIMNAAQFYRSINYGVYKPAEGALYVALIGVGSAIGRILSGFIDMMVSRRRQQGKTELLTTMFIPLAPGSLLLAYLFFIFIPARALIIPFLLGAIGNGMGWGIGSLAVRIMYAEDIGKHYNFMWTSGVISTIVLDRVMFGGIYDRKARERHTTPYCDLPSCVRLQSIILLLSNVVAVLGSVFVHIRFSRFVRREKAARQRIAEQNGNSNVLAPSN